MTPRPLWALCGALIVVPLLVLCVAVALAPHTSDFMCFWTGARFVLDGRDPYDTVAWTQAMSGRYVDAFGIVRGTFCPGRYGYPLTTAVAFLPLAALPLEVAAPIWQFLLVTGAAMGTVLIWRALEGPRAWVPYLLLLVFGSQPLWNTATNAQFGGLLLGAVGIVVYLIARQRFVAAGAAAVLLLLKPHIFAPVVFGTWSRRTVRLIVAFVVVGLLLLTASVIAQPAWPQGWLVEIRGNRLEPASQATSVWTVASWLPGGRVWALVIIAVLTAAAVDLARRLPLTAVEAVAVLASLTLVIVPYSGSHDQMLLVPAWAVVLRRSLANDHRATLASLPLIVLVLPWALYAIRDVFSGLELSTAVMPLIASLMVVLTLYRAAGMTRLRPVAAATAPR